MNKKLSMVAGAMLVGILGVPAAGADEIQEQFNTYQNWKPEMPEGLTPGTVINASNVDGFSSVLDPAMVQHIKDGWTELTVGDVIDMPLHPNYVKATVDNNNKETVTLGDQPGQINGFVAGRPFPYEPDPNDPRAGEKLAWNFKYGYNWGDNAAITPFYWKLRNMDSGKVERQFKFSFHFLNWRHRVNQAPVPEITPNPSNLFRSIYVQVLEPFDVKDTQLLIHRYTDDAKRDDAWLYLGFQRRVRRLASGQVTDAFLGTDLMIEDFEGYNGRVSDMKWTYKGTQTLLMPYYKHNEQALTDEFGETDGYKYIDFGGKGNCFAKVTWSPRKVYVVESEPVDPNHPISRRTHFADVQTFGFSRTVSYDRKGDLWKSWYICKAHPDYHLEKNKGTGVALDDCFGMIDIQAQHCTTGQFKGQIDPALNPVTKFTVQNMRTSGQ